MVKLDAELCGVIGRSYIKELILKLGYLTVVAGFCRLISQVDKPIEFEVSIGKLILTLI